MGPREATGSRAGIGLLIVRAVVLRGNLAAGLADKLFDDFLLLFRVIILSFDVLAVRVLDVVMLGIPPQVWKPSLRE